MNLTRTLPLIAIACTAVLGIVLLRDTLSFDSLARHRATLLAFRDSHYTLAAIGFVAAYAAIVALSLPGATIATLTGGFLFGIFPGVILNVTGATLGAVAIFLAARWGLGETLAARMEASSATARIKARIDENQWSALFLIRLMPVVPFFAANLIPALLAVPLYRFAVSTFLGIMPGALVYTSVGAGLGTTFDTGETPDLGVIFEPHILGPLLALCALAATPIIVKALRGRKGMS